MIENGLCVRECSHCFYWDSNARCQTQSRVPSEEFMKEVIPKLIEPLQPLNQSQTRKGWESVGDKKCFGCFWKKTCVMGLSSKLHPSLIPREKRQNYRVSERGSEASSKSMMFFLKRKEGTFMGVTEILSYVAESAWRCCTKIHAQSLASSRGRWHEITLDSIQVN